MQSFIIEMQFLGPAEEMEAATGREMSKQRKVTFHGHRVERVLTVERLSHCGWVAVIVVGSRVGIIFGERTCILTEIW